MIYTCYEMIGDCRADRPEGWAYFITNYVPVIRKLLAHYAPEKAGDATLLEAVVRGLRDPRSSMLQSMEPSPERWFIAELRQKVLAQLPAPTPEIELDLETVAAALEPLTVREKQICWLESMGYDAVESATQMRMAPETAEKIRGRASELIRGKVDTWRRGLLAENGRSLGVAAVAAKGEECLHAKTFLDILDGRMTWGGRSQLERHVAGCWHCIDHFCRLVEVVETIRGIQPLTEVEAAPLCQATGLAPRKSGWKRWFTAR